MDIGIGADELMYVECWGVYSLTSIPRLTPKWKMYAS